jgi:Flp pilus assembly pilin Flp
MASARPKKNTLHEEADKMKKLWQDEEGLTTVEYALLLALIVVAGLLAWQGLGDSVQGAVDGSTEAIGRVTD